VTPATVICPKCGGETEIDLLDAFAARIAENDQLIAADNDHIAELKEMETEA